MTVQAVQMAALNSVRMEMDQQTNFELEQDSYSTSFSPTLCVTHRCNLSCVYCYQRNKDNGIMSIDVAKKCIDDIFNHIPDNAKIIEISFIGGEPLLEMDLITDIYSYTKKYYSDERLVFFATTNGTTLSEDDKVWFYEHRKDFVLGLSLDGTPQTHNVNRTNSYDKIDIPFFVNTWPKQGPKMTISKHSIRNLAQDIIHIHEQGFININGVNFAEGDFDWESEDTLNVLAEQLRILLDYYTEHSDINLDQMFGKHIEFCAGGGDKHKSCGIGTRTLFYDIDGKRYPCSFITPMTFTDEELEVISKVNFYNNSIFVDEECSRGCYLFPVCGTCSGANYLVNKSFNNRIKSRCKMNKLISLYIAELHMRRILQHRELYQDENQVYFLIEAIRGIKENYYSEFQEFLL